LPKERNVFSFSAWWCRQLAFQSASWRNVAIIWAW
jgi:hypothetical protein